MLLYKDNGIKVYKYIKYLVRKNDYFYFNYLLIYWFFVGIVIVFCLKKIDI